MHLKSVTHLGHPNNCPMPYGCHICTCSVTCNRDGIGQSTSKEARELDAEAEDYAHRTFSIKDGVILSVKDSAPLPVLIDEEFPQRFIYTHDETRFIEKPVQTDDPVENVLRRIKLSMYPHDTKFTLAQTEYHFHKNTLFDTKPRSGEISVSIDPDIPDNVRIIVSYILPMARIGDHRKERRQHIGTLGAAVREILIVDTMMHPMRANSKMKVPCDLCYNLEICEPTTTFTWRTTAVIMWFVFLMKFVIEVTRGTMSATGTSMGMAGRAFGHVSQ